MRPAEAEFLAGGWTDMAKLIVALRSFANAPKNRNSSRYFDYVRTFQYNDVEHSNCNARKEGGVVLQLSFSVSPFRTNVTTLQPSALKQK
jgi:hypothetical protein